MKNTELFGIKECGITLLKALLSFVTENKELHLKNSEPNKQMKAKIVYEDSIGNCKINFKFGLGRKFTKTVSTTLIKMTVEFEMHNYSDI